LSINWQFSRTVALASIRSAWENRNSLLAPGFAIGVIDYISLMERMSSIAPALQFVSLALVVTLAILIHRSLLYALSGVLLPAEYPLPKDLRISEYQAPEAIQTRLFYIVIASSVVGLTGFAALFSRFYLLLPAAATDQFVSVAEVWEKTKANQWPMFLILFIPLVLLLPVSYSYQYKSLLPLLLAVELVILVFIFSSISIGYYLVQNQAGD